MDVTGAAALFMSAEYAVKAVDGAGAGLTASIFSRWCEGGVEAEAASGTTERQAGGHDHGNEELPDPRRPPLGDPEAREPGEGGKRNETGGETEHEQDAEGELDYRL